MTASPSMAECILNGSPYRSSLVPTGHQTVATGERAMVVTTSAGQSAQRLLPSLVSGELNAVDAALSLAFSQVVLSAGAWVSLAGILSAAVFDAETGEVAMLDAGYALPAAENMAGNIASGAQANGRAVLVPGFMAGAEALRARYGRAGWPELLQPAIENAGAGIEVGSTLARLIEFRAEALTRRPEGRAIFAPEGRLLKKGERLVQHDLAALLGQVAREGPRAMLDGRWSEKFASLVGQAGGRITAQDFTRYRPSWSQPRIVPFQGHEVLTSGEQLGGLCLLESLSRLSELKLSNVGPYWRDPDTLARILRASHYCYLRALDPDRTRSVGRIAEFVEAGPKPIALADRLTGPPDMDTHSDAIVIIDPRGHVVILCHSINTTAWGETGLFVDGVSVPDSAGFQQRLLAGIAPGGRVPNALATAIAFRDRQPVAAMGAVGGSVSEIMLQMAVGLLGQGLSPSEALKAPQFLRSVWPAIGLFQLLLVSVATLIIGVGIYDIFAQGIDLSGALMVLACLANVGFGAMVVFGYYGHCNACIARADWPRALMALSLMAFLIIAYRLTVEAEQLTDRIMLLLVGITLVGFAPVLRGSLVPVNLVLPESFGGEMIRNLKHRRLALREISEDPPFGLWAGMRFDGRKIEGAVSPTSIDGIAIAD